ncbi:MAG TPA: two-component system response regulator NarL [Burkholderiaceae bacterium]|jgi:two-component system nitrate/nitrite response regulator NarL|nr:two-component system response regulator NarL [Burkholderiaceae bacterium]HPE01661.1 two-component system response regulator NarL [Burkholderiaceae bacterium]HRZ01431.1 two-component system response regulator NarL [Burkholderiaceae bacterium]
MKHTILVVDDHPLFRKGVIQLLAMEPSFDVVGEAGHFDEAVRIAREKEPDLTLLDLNMKGGSGLEVLAALKEEDPARRVVMLTVSDAPEDLMAAIRAGADGYLLKDMEPEDLLARVRESLEGRTVIGEALTNALATALRDEARADKRDLRELTEREQDVLRCVASGMSNKMIARALNITEGTVKVHVKHMLKKLGFRSRVEAAVWAAERGLRAP